MGIGWATSSRFRGNPPRVIRCLNDARLWGLRGKWPSVALGSVAGRGACAWDGRARVSEREKEEERENPGAGRERRVRVRTCRGRENGRERGRGGRAARLAQANVRLQNRGPCR